MDKKFVLLNGPKRSGKDTVGKLIGQALNRDHYRSQIFDDPILDNPPVAVFSIADDLKELTHEIFGLPYGADHYEKVKDEVSDDFITAHGPISPRAAYIYVSENIMKPLFGEDVFSERYIRKCEMQYPKSRMVVNTSLGFQAELVALARMVSPQNIMVIRVHREGYDFTGDSRSWVHARETSEIRQMDIQNIEGLNWLTHLSDQVLPTVRKFFNGEI